MIGLSLTISAGSRKRNEGIESLAPISWLDPSDLSTMFQDAAGTIPVMTSGDPVARINDKSGNGYDALQTANNSFRPTYQTDGTHHWLQFDGVDDYLSVTFPQSLSQPSTQGISFSTGSRAACYLTDGADSSGRNSLRYEAFSLHQFGGSDVVLGPVAEAAPNIVVAKFDGVESDVRLNGSDFGPHNVGTHSINSLTIGARFSLNVRFDGLLRGFVLFDRNLGTAETAKLASCLKGSA